MGLYRKRLLPVQPERLGKHLARSSLFCQLHQWPGLLQKQRQHPDRGVQPDSELVVVRDQNAESSLWQSCLDLGLGVC